ncbi:G-protein coupled receptors family 1 profile domain-containing protein [Caenorhabditis elegans]|uniref:G-protein coupled receptors family 1 profile domain-containing protein n=1 Tax=Caenorhabditis elegans TaxID=6239 RepID=H2KZT2_CAEEL|nr:G-protein coupled receptors family 1 profile domain-containing protein [Caenorhabditis elegans]CCD69659.1 G-protein coupled receptors family 1 profile domain-containing protein [Caenorhabditis elegans]|eukprot:NP_001023818.1 Serpentine Receptor, class W [Caenorhabditis elegans]
MKIVFPLDVEGLDESTINNLMSIGNSISKIKESSLNIFFVLSCVGVVVNIFHLFILTRKSMVNNSIHVMMIGISVCDLLLMSLGVYGHFDFLLRNNDECSPPQSYVYKLFEFWRKALQDHSRRVSAWYGVMMALMRLLIVKFVLNPKFDILSKPLFSYIFMSVAFIVSSGMTLYFWVCFEYITMEIWNPPKQCTGFPPNFSMPRYKSSLEDISLIKHRADLLIFVFIDGFFKIIPAIMFPIITFLLIKQLRAANSKRRQISQRNGSENSNATDQTTKLVTLMAVTFIAAELPNGTIYIIQVVMSDYAAIVKIGFGLIDILAIFVALNATIHCLICLTVSSHYRKTVKDVFKCCRKNSITKIEPTVPGKSFTMVKQKAME